MKQPSKDLIMMWTQLCNSSYWSMVLNYEYNKEIKELALELGLYHKCKNSDNLIDRTKYVFC